jgi:large conductance mechanosensitive channel
VNNLVMPIVAMIIGKPDFSNLTFTINDAVFRYGAFITDAITFIATAAAVFFFVVKPMNAITARMRRPGEEAISDEERRHQELLAALRARAKRRRDRGGPPRAARGPATRAELRAPRSDPAAARAPRRARGAPPARTPPGSSCRVGS